MTLINGIDVDLTMLTEFANAVDDRNKHFDSLLQPVQSVPEFGLFVEAIAVRDMYGNRKFDLFDAFNLFKQKVALLASRAKEIKVGYERGESEAMLAMVARGALDPMNTTTGTETQNTAQQWSEAQSAS